MFSQYYRRDVLLCLILLSVINKIECQINPATLEGRVIGFLAGGKCLKEVKTDDLQRARLNVQVNPSSPRPGVSLIEVCCDGYTQNIHNLNECYPLCTKGCPNGLCVSPEVCQCYQGYVRNLGNECVPTCPISCPNGRCSGQSCICNNGFTLDPTAKFCMAKCEFSCGRNAFCEAPGRCRCLDGYSLKNQICTPECNIPCTNGICSGPNQCSCNPGFSLINNVCQRGCPGGCTNGICSERGFCTCSQGWILNRSGTGCDPLCEGGCLNGKCVRPNVCNCNPGYTLVGRECKPQCSRGCRGGTCTAPEQCVCPANYIHDSYQGICVYRSDQVQPPTYRNNTFAPRPPSSQQASCSQPCLNGVCSGQNECTCNPGYIRDPRDWFRCQPYCADGCPNGTCSSPNYCICNRNYRKVSGVCQRM